MLIEGFVMTLLAVGDGSQVPDGIDTLEKALAWLLSLADNLYAGQTYKETDGTVTSGLAPLVDVSIINAADGTKRMLARVAIPLDENYATDTSAKLWAFANDWGSASVPASFQAD